MSDQCIGRIQKPCLAPLELGALVASLHTVLLVIIGATFFGETFVILQSRFVLIIILSAIILRERAGLVRRCTGMAITALSLFLMIGVD